MWQVCSSGEGAGHHVIGVCAAFLMVSSTVFVIFEARKSRTFSLNGNTFLRYVVHSLIEV
jgi:hypothetical protein